MTCCIVQSIIDVALSLGVAFLLGMLYLLASRIRKYFNKPPKHFHRTIITLADLDECINMFMYTNTIYEINDSLGYVHISLYNQNIFAFGFMRRVALLKAEVATNLPVGLQVHWFVSK